MAETQQDPNPQEPKNDAGTGGDGGDPEAQFWAKLDKRLEEGIDRALSKRDKARQQPGTSRNGGRTSLPSILADLVFGPPKGDGG